MDVAGHVWFHRRPERHAHRIEDRMLDLEVVLARRNGIDSETSIRVGDPDDGARIDANDGATHRAIANAVENGAKNGRDRLRLRGWVLGDCGGRDREESWKESESSHGYESVTPDDRNGARKLS